MNQLFREFLTYDSATGVFTWTKRPSSKAAPGAVAGVLNSLGYRQIKLRGERYYAHRLAWFFIHGVEPGGELDHINGNPDDNRIANLRVCSRSENLQNRRGNALTGTYFDARRGLWVAEIVGPAGKVYLGSFAEATAGATAYAIAKARLHPFSPEVRL